MDSDIKITKEKSMTINEVHEACHKFLAYLQANGIESGYMALSVPDEILADKRNSLIFQIGLNQFEMIGISQLMVQDVINSGIRKTLNLDSGRSRWTAR